MKRPDGAGRHASPAGNTRTAGRRGRPARAGSAPRAAAGRGLGHWVRRRLAAMDRRTLRRHLARCPRCAGQRPAWHRPMRLFAPSTAAVALFIGALTVARDRMPMRLVMDGAHTPPPGPSRLPLPAPPADPDAVSWAPIWLAVGCLGCVAVVLLFAYAWRSRRADRAEQARQAAVERELDEPDDELPEAVGE